VGVLVMLSGVSMTAVLFALVTNGLIQRFEAHAHGRVRLRVADHVVVCGLGVVGYRVAQDLTRRGRRVVVVERDEGGRFVAAARAEGLSVVIGDALDPETLLHASLGRARALIVCTNPDYLNLEIALHARSLMPSLPVVLRLFDPELARRVADVFQFRRTFSGAALAAPQIAAAGARDAALGTLRFYELRVTLRRTSALEGESVGSAGRRAGGLPVAAISRGRLACAPDTAAVLAAGDAVITAHRSDAPA